MIDQEDLIRIANMEMPFGKYKGRVLIDLPEAYLLWFQRHGFPKGRLGELLEFVLSLKVEGLEGLLRPLRNQTEIN